MTKAKRSPGKQRTTKSVGNSDIKEYQKDTRSVKDVLDELRDIVKISGIKEVHNFIDEIGAPVKTKKNANIQQPKVPRKACQKPDHSEFETKIGKLENECQKYKTEVGRYKHEYEVMVKQVEISKDTVTSLETQVGDLKNIVSRLTKNNGELLDIVSEKINYEDMIADLEKNKAILTKHLSEEKSRSAVLEERLHSAEAEVAGLRALSAEVRAGVRHGLAGLELPRPNSRHDLPNLGDKTKHILGIGDGVNDRSDTEDSAFDDPNTESLRSRPKSGQNKEVAKPLAPLLSQQTVPQQPGPVTQVLRLGVPSIPSSPPTKMTNSPKPPSTFLPPPATTTTAQSRSSTMVESPPPLTFQPLPLDLSETLSESSHVQIEKQVLPQDQDVPTKQSLETKVSSFLSRLHQDSLHLQISQPIPQAEPFPGPSMHLSLSSSDMEQDNTGQSINTTLTEGRFLRGLETSIEVLQAELTKNSE